MRNLVDFTISFALPKEKGRELVTVNERRAYSPFGYSISPLPAMDDRVFALFWRAKKAKANGLASVVEEVTKLRGTNMPQGAEAVKR